MRDSLLTDVVSCVWPGRRGTRKQNAASFNCSETRTKTLQKHKTPCPDHVLPILCVSVYGGGGGGDKISQKIYIFRTLIDDLRRRVFPRNEDLRPYTNYNILSHTLLRYDSWTRTVTRRRRPISVVGALFIILFAINLLTLIYFLISPDPLRFKKLQLKNN